jgi:hypothetical protein
MQHPVPDDIGNSQVIIVQGGHFREFGLHGKQLFDNFPSQSFGGIVKRIGGDLDFSGFLFRGHDRISLAVKMDA